jgi:hypothetical protein
MLERMNGLDATYVDGRCTWVMAEGNGVLTSNSFGSCVGLALWGPRHQRGVVAHFAGGLGINLRNVKRYTVEILREACPVQPGIWHGWVFGGVSIHPGSCHITSTGETLTKPLMRAVREALQGNPYIPVNVARRAAERRAVEADDSQFIAHSAVALDVSTGTITWPAVASVAASGGSADKVTVKLRRNSGF